MYLGVGLTDPKVILFGTFVQDLYHGPQYLWFGGSGPVLRGFISFPAAYPKLDSLQGALDHDVAFVAGGRLTPVIPDTSSRLNLATSFLRDTYSTIRLGFKGRVWTLGVANALQSVTLLGLCF